MMSMEPFQLAAFINDERANDTSPDSAGIGDLEKLDVIMVTAGAILGITLETELFKAPVYNSL